MSEKGIVQKSTGSWYLVNNGSESLIPCRLRGKFRKDMEHDIRQTNPIAVGDIVEFDMNDDGSGQIFHIQERRNRIPRQATHGRQGIQIIAANVDKAFAVQSVRQPKFKQGFIDRFLVCCEAYHITPVVILNKFDLARKQDLEDVDQIIQLYKEIGYDIITTSIYDEASLKVLEDHLKNNTSVFIGHSGVGKSSLLNAIEPNLSQTVGAVSESSNKGKHTTTYSELFPLKNGGYLVDTPGIREFGLVNIDKYELATYFPEMRAFIDQCKFYNCTHDHEPNCAIREAVENQQISEMRYKSYLQISDSL